MRVVPRGETEVAELMQSGAEADKHTVSVSHQLRIGREDTWVRYEYTSAARAGESPEDAAARVADYVNNKVMEIVEQTVSTVQERN